jgi:hypothetical protein
MAEHLAEAEQVWRAGKAAPIRTRKAKAQR